jgi:hypothetical protein
VCIAGHPSPSLCIDPRAYAAVTLCRMRPTAGRCMVEYMQGSEPSRTPTHINSTALQFFVYTSEQCPAASLPYCIDLPWREMGMRRSFTPVREQIGSISGQSLSLRCQPHSKTDIMIIRMLLQVGCMGSRSLRVGSNSWNILSKIAPDNSLEISFNLFKSYHTARL